MTLLIELRVKFRWLFDWGKVHETIPLYIPLPGGIKAPPFAAVLYDKRGVYLKVSA